MKSKGRMINKSISTSENIAKLSPKALSLFCLLIPHYNSYGKMKGNVHFIKGEVCPLIDWLKPEDIENCLNEISTITNVKLFKNKGLDYIQSLNFYDHQKLRDDRKGVDELPNYSGSTPGINKEPDNPNENNEVDNKPDYSRTTPGLLPIEVKLSKEEEEGEDKGEDKEKYLSDSVEIRLSKLLFSKIKERNENQKKPNFQSWGNEINKMLRIDKRSPEDTEAIILWCQENDFWKNNILSTAKLRKHFDTLLLQSKKDLKKTETTTPEYLP